jgi:hypothetical protein
MAEFEGARKRLWDDLVTLHDAWAQYRYLFTDPERVEILNACGRWFFGLVQRLLLREVLLGISRLTDPPSQGKQANLVLASLLEDPALDRDSDVSREMKVAIAAVVARAAGVRLHRHKYIAHRDHETAVRLSEEPLPGLTVQEITDLISAMGAVYSLHNLRMRGMDTSFALEMLGGADAVVQILADSDCWREWQEVQQRNPPAF